MPNGKTEVDEFAQEALAKTKKLVWIERLLKICGEAIRAAGPRVPRVVISLTRDTPGGWAEVYPGVIGQVVGFRKKANLGDAGEVRITYESDVRVNARSFITALERDGVIVREPVA